MKLFLQRTGYYKGHTCYFKSARGDYWISSPGLADAINYNYHLGFGRYYCTSLNIMCRYFGVPIRNIQSYI